MSQAAKKQPSGHPQTHTSYYASSSVPVPDYDRRGAEPAGALTQMLNQLSMASQPPQTPSKNVNVVLFGEQGVGKSAVVNLIARKTIAPVPSGVRGFPLQSTRYDNRVDGVDVSIFETTGLDEPEIRKNEYLVVLEKAHDLVHKLSAAGGVHLLLFCVRGDRLTATTQINYRLFSEVIFQANVPLAIVVTGLEGESVLGDWWARNKALVDRYGIKNEGHACITTIPGRSPVQDYKYAESHRKIRELLKSCCLTTSPSLPNPMDWFFCLWDGMQPFVDKYRRPSPEKIMNTLTMRLNLDLQTARAFLEGMDRGDAYQSGRGGEGSSGPRGAPAPAVMVNNRDWEGEDDPRSATSARSQESDAGMRSLEPHRAGSMETDQPWSALDPGRGSNEPPRRATAEMAITPSQSRYSNAVEEDGAGGRRDDSARRREIKVETRKEDTLMEPHTKTEMDVSNRTLDSRVFMEDIRSSFPHDLTGHVTRSSKHPFASGSFGDIYRGKFILRGESIEVAIKAYKVYLQRDQHVDDRLKRFHREITVWLNLRHPNVLPLYGTVRDANMHPDIPAMVCPWVESGALSGYLDANKDLSVTQILILLNDVARGLQYLHSQGVIHGDLSGSNVLVQADGRACISDFGLSTLLTMMGGPSMTTSRRTEGTVRWMAPELLNPHSIQRSGPTMRSDVYSFGSIMFQILTGNIPYHHLSRDVQVIAAILNGAKPDRPLQRVLTNGRWKFITECWSDGGRPSSDEIVDFTQRELAKTPLPHIIVC